VTQEEEFEDVLDKSATLHFTARCTWKELIVKNNNYASLYQTSAIVMKTIVPHI
jgi:hypothetical protein